MVAEVVLDLVHLPHLMVQVEMVVQVVVQEVMDLEQDQEGQEIHLP